MSDKISILIAEDNLSIVDSIKFWYSKKYNIVFVNNVNDAIETIKNGFVPEVALIDWKLKSDKASDETERLRLKESESFDLIKYIQDEAGGKCRTVLMPSLDYAPAKWFFRGAESWGYFSKMSNLSSLEEVFDQGFLREDEIGKPMIFLPYVEPGIHNERG